MGDSAIARLAEAGRTVDVEVSGETVKWNVPLDDDAKELLDDMIRYGDTPKQSRVDTGIDLIQKWVPRLIDGADALSTEQLSLAVRRIGYLKSIRALQECSGLQVERDPLGN